MSGEKRNKGDTPITNKIILAVQSELGGNHSKLGEGLADAEYDLRRRILQEKGPMDPTQLESEIRHGMAQRLSAVSEDIATLLRRLLEEPKSE